MVHRPWSYHLLGLWSLVFFRDSSAVNRQSSIVKRKTWNEKRPSSIVHCPWSPSSLVLGLLSWFVSRQSSIVNRETKNVKRKTSIVHRPLSILSFVLGPWSSFVNRDSSSVNLTIRKTWDEKRKTWNEKHQSFIVHRPWSIVHVMFYLINSTTFCQGMTPT